MRMRENYNKNIKDRFLLTQVKQNETSVALLKARALSQ